jgi:hypothetical protein
MFARVPGLWQYRQLRLAANRPDLWPAVQGISFDAPAVAQPQGMPHGLFLSEADLVEFGSNPIARETIPNDARNFIGRIGAQLSPPSSGRTLVDRINDPAMQGPPPVPTFALCLVPRAGGASAEAFHRYLTEHVARPWSRHPGVMRLRVEPLPPYDRSVMRSPGVAHRWPNDETYLGRIELAVRNEGVVGDLLAGTAAGELAEQVGAVHTYPVREVYTTPPHNSRRAPSPAASPSRQPFRPRPNSLDHDQVSCHRCPETSLSPMCPNTARPYLAVYAPNRRSLRPPARRSPAVGRSGIPDVLTPVKALKELCNPAQLDVMRRVNTLLTTDSEAERP